MYLLELAGMHRKAIVVFCNGCCDVVVLQDSGRQFCMLNRVEAMPGVPQLNWMLSIEVSPDRTFSMSSLVGR